MIYNKIIVSCGWARYFNNINVKSGLEDGKVRGEFRLSQISKINNIIFILK